MSDSPGDPYTYGTSLNMRCSSQAYMLIIGLYKALIFGDIVETLGDSFNRKK